MPMTLPSNMILEKNKVATSSPWIIFLDIHLKDSQGVTQQSFYLCNNTENITWSPQEDPQEYTAFPFNLQPTRNTAQGEIPAISLSVSNVTQVIQDWLEQLDGGVGSEVVVRVALVEAGPTVTGDSELIMTFEVLGAECTAEWVVFTLGAPGDMRLRFPLDRYIANHCNWEFKSAECGYSGAGTTCERNFDACKAYNNTARFGGHPGLHPTGLRLV